MDNIQSINDTLKTQKLAEQIESCEDASKVEGNLYVISDGAGQGFLSGKWAELVVSYFCKDYEVFSNNPIQWLKNVQEEWQIHVKKLVEQKKEQRSKGWIPYFNAFSQKKRAAATLLGGEIHRNGENLTLKLFILGDSCVFLISDGYFKQVDIATFETYPLKHSSQFNDTPYLLNSYTEANLEKIEFISLSKTIHENTYILFATDALSKWIFQNHEQNKRGCIWDLLSQSNESFESWTRKQKEETGLEDDDITLLKISYYLTSSNVENINKIENIEENHQKRINNTLEAAIEHSNDEIDSLSSVEDNNIVNLLNISKPEENSIIGNTTNKESNDDNPISKEELKQVETPKQEQKKDHNNVIILDNEKYLIPITLVLVLIFISFIYLGLNSIRKIAAISNHNRDIKPSVNEMFKQKDQDTLLVKGTKIYNEKNELIIILQQNIRVKVNLPIPDIYDNIGFIYEGDVFVSKGGNGLTSLNWIKEDLQGYIDIYSANLRKDTNIKSESNKIGKLIITQKFDYKHSSKNWCSITFKGKLKKKQ